MKLTVKNIPMVQLEPGKTEQIIFDTDIPGFGLRLRQGGYRGLIFQYKHGDRQRRIAMGAVDAIDLAKAREDAKRYYARVRLGEDPAGDIRDAKVKCEETFEKAAELFLSKQRTSLRPKSYVDVERHILILAKPLHEMGLAKIERRHIAARLTETEQGSGLITANRLRASLSKFFSWSMGQGLVDANPVTGTNKNAEVSRDRVLSSDELRAIWLALPDNDYGPIVKLLMLTGARASEISDLRRSEIVDDEIRLSGKRTKNHRPHVIPLSASALVIISAQPICTKSDGSLRDLLFGKGQGGFSGWSGAKEQLDRRIEEMGKAIAPWRIHDLRRSFATHAAEMGIQPHIIEACLNHVSGHKGGIAGVYNRASYESEKRAALVRWAEHLMSIVEHRESNVTTLRRPA
jgi:integrase